MDGQLPVVLLCPECCGREVGEEVVASEEAEEHEVVDGALQAEGEPEGGGAAVAVVWGTCLGDLLVEQNGMEIG